MTDIVERLRKRAEEEYEMLDNIHEPLLEAADTIEALRAENALHVQQIAEFAERSGDDMNALRAENAKLREIMAEETKDSIAFIRKQADKIARMREALRPFAEGAGEYGISVPSHYPADEYTFKVGELRAARAAMGESDATT